MHINIAYSSDQNYSQHMAVSMLSLFEYNKNIDEITIYVVERDISSDTKARLFELAKKYSRELVFIPFYAIANKINVDDSFPIAAFGRLFLADIINVERLLYVDCDSIFGGSLDELWTMDMNGCYVAGVQDIVKPYYRTVVGLSKNDPYINSGFILFDMEKWRCNYMEDKCKQVIQSFKGHVPHNDQGVLNYVCKGHMNILLPKYNLTSGMLRFSVEQLKRHYQLTSYYSDKELDLAIKYPIFIHFTNGYDNRPWNKKCTHPFKQNYLHFLNMTPWKDCLFDEDLSRELKIKKQLFKLLPFILYDLLMKCKDAITGRYTI